MKITPRAYQQEAFDAAIDYLHKTNGDPVLDLPTGSGKSVIVAMLCQRLADWGVRAVILQPSKELLEQNVARAKQLCPDLSIGVYSASLRSKQKDADFVFATIGSVVNKEHELGERSLIIVDECHLIPSGDGGQYNTFRQQLRALNPKLRMIGLTATPFRLDSGPIVGDSMPFTGLAYKLPVRRLLDEGHICGVKSVSVSKIDTSGLRRSGWDYNKSDLQDLFGENVGQSVSETVKVAEATGAKSCLCFASGIEHAWSVKSHIETMTNERVEVVTGETLPLERSQTIADFKAGRLRWLVNCDVLTTGFDAPNVDLIAVMRATLSAGLFAQIVGRGMRNAPGKDVCYLLDFGGNVARHGAIDDEDYGNKPKKGAEGSGEAIMKSCPCCGALCYAASRECGCGFQFPKPMVNVEAKADSLNDVMNATAGPKKGWAEVPIAEVLYFTHRKEGKPDSMRIVYKAQKIGDEIFAQEYSEWVCLEHDGPARKMAEKKWAELSLNHCPDTTCEALKLADAGALAKPSKIAVKQDGKYWRVKLPKNLKKPPYVEFPEMEAPF